MVASTKVVIDASFLLSFLLPDEQDPEVDQFFDEYRIGKYRLTSVRLLFFEVFNALLLANKQKRLTSKQMGQISQKLMQLAITYIEPDWELCLKLATRHDLTIYDASYLEVAESHKLSLMTLDKKLISAKSKIE